jgi:RNA polymerase sigma factor (sigma-70 family)
LPLITIRLETGYWHKVRQGEEQAFMDMYDHYYQALYTFGCRINSDQELIKDVIHEMYCELWENRLNLPEVHNEKAYLFTYLKRKILKSLASNQRKANFQKDLKPEDELSYETALIQAQHHQESTIKLQEVLRRITPTQLKIIEYKFFEMMSYEEIAIKLDLSQRTVYNQVYEALKTMRSHFKVILDILIILYSSFIIN